MSDKDTETRIQTNLFMARRFADEGEATVMESSLELAATAAAQTGRDISKERREIEQIGYRNAVLKELSIARTYGISDSISMDACINLAERYAQKTGQDISQEVKEIRGVA